MKIIFHDVDGCLNADVAVPLPMAGEPMTHRQIEKLAELGRRLDTSTVDVLAINTGRSLADTLPLVNAVRSEKLKYIVAEHGAAYFDIAAEQEITPTGPLAEELRRIHEFIDWYRQRGGEILNERVGATVPVLDKTANLTLDVRDGLDAEAVYKEIQSIVCNDSPFEHNAFVFHFSQTDGYVDVMSKVDKGDGIRVIASMLSARSNSGVKITTVAIGNGLNDMSMLEAADLPVCPGNAEPEVSEYCQSRSGVVSDYPCIEATLCFLAQA